MSRVAESLRALVALTLVAACSAPVEPPAAGDWPQFRGPGGLGIAPDGPLPERWSANSPNIRWRARVPGSGSSSPIVSRDRVFLTTTYESPDDGWSESMNASRLQRVVLAYDLQSGEKLWETSVYEGPVGKKHWTNTHATPTPVTDGERIVVSFDGHLAALDLDGEVLWRREVDPDYLLYSQYGASSSPVLAGQAIVLLQDREFGKSPDPGWIAAFDKESGDELWRDEWSHTCCSYSTPLVVDRAGRLEVWSQTAGEASAYDARSGEKLWQVEISSTQTVPSIVRQGDLLSAPGGMHTRGIEMFRLPEGDRAATPELLWSSNQNVPEISSPVLYRGRIFTVAKNGMMVIREALTGEVVGRRRLPHGEYRPSLVAGDGKVYASTEEGLTVVIDAEASPPSVIARNRLGGGSGASPAIAGASLMFRTKRELVRIDRVHQAAPAGPAAAS